MGDSERHGRAVIRRLIAILFLSFAGFQLVAPSPAAAQSYSFSKVQVEGNQRIEAATVLSYLGINRGETMSAGELNDAYQRLVRSGLFSRVDVFPRGSTLVVKVVERPTINRVSIEGNKRLKDDLLEGLLVSQSRHVFSPSTAEADAARITEAYAGRGRIGVVVDPVVIQRTNNRVDLVFEVQETRNVEVERVSFIGNRHFSDGRLRRVLATKQAGILRAIVQADTFVPERLEFDRQVLTDFYNSRGYVDFETVGVSSDLSRERSGYHVTFQVREGQQFRFGKISAVSYVDGVSGADFEAALRLRSGAIYNPALVQNNLLRLERVISDKRLDFVKVEPVITRNERDLTLDIEFQIVRGARVIVERIDIEGNATTLDRVVRQQFSTAEGDPFNPREIRAAAERIRALGFFSNVDVQARDGSGPDNVVIDVNVDEAPTGSFAFGGTYSTSQGLGFNVSFSERNFLGRGQYLSLAFTTGGGAGTFDLTFAEPHFLGRNLEFGLNSYYTRTKSTSTAFYESRQYHFEPSLEFATSELGRLRVNVFGDGADITGVDAVNSSAVLVAEEARGSQIGFGAGLEYNFDTRRNGLTANRGLKGAFGVDIGGFGSDYSYAKASGTLAAQTAIMNDQVTLRATLEGGALVSLNGGDSRITDRFHLGSNLLRGFEPNGVGPRDRTATNEDALGGNFFAVARLEADFPLGLPEEYGIRGGLFLDVGSVWGLDNNLGGAIDDAPYLRSTIGASLFWDTPIGPLRFNYSYAIAKESYDVENNFELTISTKF